MSHGELINIGMVLGRRLTDTTGQLTHSWAHQYRHRTSIDIRRSLDEFSLSDEDAHLLDYAAPMTDFELPENGVRPIRGVPLHGIDLNGRELDLWSGDVGKVGIRDPSGSVKGMAYPHSDITADFMDRLAIPDRIGAYTTFRFLNGGKAEYTGAGGLPWLDGTAIYVHAELDAKRPAFVVKADVPTFDPHDDRLDLGGTTVELEPEHFAKVVAHERVLRDLANAEPERSLVMLAGKAGRPDETVAFRFTEALHREGFTRDVYFATGSQIMWDRRPFLAVEEAYDNTGRRLPAWEVYPATEGRTAQLAPLRDDPAP
ncbi:hypothetical protein AB0F65_13985 [Nocardia rhamnosiphila]|uniref:hypothetical protein n=1 Tax=Nocardia rhamnosiphila TaxID=426716 RepID=UPI0033D75241